MARPVTLFTGQWADLPLDGAGARSPAHGLRRPGAGVLGRPLRCAAGARERRLRAGQARAAGGSTACAASRSATTSWARRCATASTSATRPSCRRTCGATAIPRACASAPRARCRTPRAPPPSWASKSVTGFTGSSHLALDLRVPADLAGLLGQGFRRFRASASDPILDASSGRGVQLRAGGAPDGDRLRHRLGAARDRGRGRAQALRLQLRPQPPGLPGRGLRASSSAPSPTASSTRT